MADDVSSMRLPTSAGYQPPKSAEELLSRYAAGERYFPEADIEDGSSLEGAILEGAVFVSAWLSDVNFRGANLRGVRFEECNVKCSDFDNADLRSACFPRTHVEAISLKDAKLDGSSFAGALAYGGEYFEGQIPLG